MSVLEYIYPADAAALALDSLVLALQRAVPGLIIAEIEAADRKIPNWSSLTLRHPGKFEFKSLVVCSKNTRANINDLRSKYDDSRNLPVAVGATRYFWSQLKLPRRCPDARISEAIDTHRAILATIVRLSHGVIDIPENERLYGAKGFSRYAKRRA